ncbi:hypothetical protein DOY81_010617, partial [Sarcophaga bullata]
MANAIILNVVVAGSSSTTRTKHHHKNNCNRENIDNKRTTTITTTNNDWKINKTTHRIVDLVCKCLCHFVKPSTESSSSAALYQQHLNRKHQSKNSNFDTAIDSTSAINNETLDSHNSYTSCEECLCVKSPEDYFKSHSIESFSNLNISSSTAFENTSSEEVYGKDTSTPPSRHHSHNSRALGILQEKRSPLFGPSTNTPSKGVSLRSENPFYSQNISLRSKEDLAQLKSSTKKCKENIDYTATEALSMNGGKQLNNGPFTKSYLVGVGNGGTDINRNGASKNW